MTKYFIKFTAEDGTVIEKPLDEIYQEFSPDWIRQAFGVGFYGGGKGMRVADLGADKLIKLIAEKDPLWLLGTVMGKVWEGESEFIEYLTTRIYNMPGFKWPKSAESLWESERRMYSEHIKEPIYYTQSIAHDKRIWDKLDLDHTAMGRNFPGSYFGKGKYGGCVSFDVINEMESYRAENDKEAFYKDDDWDNYIQKCHEPRPKADPYGEAKDEFSREIVEFLTETPSHLSGEPEQIDQDDLLNNQEPEIPQKLKAINDEAQYIIKHIWGKYSFNDPTYESKYPGKKPAVKPYDKKINSKPFSVIDEQKKRVMSCYIPRHKRRGVDPNLINELETMFTESDESYMVTSGKNPIEWPIYHSRRNVGVTACVYNFWQGGIYLDGTFEDLTLDLNLERRNIVDITDVGLIDLVVINNPKDKTQNTELAEITGLQKDDLLVIKAWVLRPEWKKFTGEEWNQYHPGWWQVHMADHDIAKLLMWDIKRVRASMKRIKRAKDKIKSNLFLPSGHIDTVPERAKLSRPLLGFRECPRDCVLLWEIILY